MIRKQFWYGFFWVLITVTTPLLLWVFVLDKCQLRSKRDRLAQWFLSTVGRLMVRLSGSTVTVRGIENIPQGPVVFVSNHQSHFDSALIFGFIPKPKGFIAAIEASRFPIWSNWFRYAPTVFMRRGDARQSLLAIKQGIEFIKQGYSLTLYPEGIISRGPHMGPFKRGSLKLATVPKVPIVPITIKDSYKIMGEDNTKIRPTAIAITISQPIQTQNLTREELAELPTRLEKIIRSHL